MRRSTHLSGAIVAAFLLAAPTAFAADTPTAGGVADTASTTTTLPEVKDWDTEVYGGDRPVALYIVTDKDCSECDAIEARLAKQAGKYSTVKFVKVKEKDSPYLPLVQFRLPGIIGGIVQLDRSQLTEEKIDATIGQRVNFALSEWKLQGQIKADNQEQQSKQKKLKEEITVIGNKINDLEHSFSKEITDQDNLIKAKAKEYDDLIARLQFLKQQALSPLNDAAHEIQVRRFGAEKPLRQEIEAKNAQYDKDRLEASRRTGRTEQQLKDLIGLDQKEAERNGTK